uniref:Tetratricopeptide repeat-containing protein n=1 Tax=Candidatus Kentrum sp. MB TaxID=2138164 RepID=A0A450XP50_9GAMM|nr:MAG: Tetratricopeptide repeat-containing protein [Candidatus Kentron sp. MB]VFK31037.1 MAG: Tetratricopeptide repeat-containing protein [Candidatus Kentron sp. MB]VFK75493.1 MAG: Tetratricopeptide repeat-containing protein [Candidatus Kentron sp. MB]
MQISFDWITDAAWVTAISTGAIALTTAAARHRGALAHYQRAAEYDPDDPDAWNRIGHLKDRLGELADAQAAYERVLAIGEQTNNQEAIAMALGNRGLIAQTCGELGKAEGYYRRSLAIDKELGRKEGMASQFFSFPRTAWERENPVKPLSVADKHFVVGR